LRCCCSLRNTYKVPSTKPAPLLKEFTQHSLPRLSAPASLSRETKPPQQQPQQQCKQGFYSRQQALEKTLKHNELQQSMKPISSSSSFSRFFFSSFSSSSSSPFTNRARAWKHEQQNHGWLDFFTYGQQKWKMNSNNKITETHPKNPKTHNKTTQFKPNQKQKNYQTKPKPKTNQLNSNQKNKIKKTKNNSKPNQNPKPYKTKQRKNNQNQLEPTLRKKKSKINIKPKHKTRQNNKTI
jgi:hypothetical protein